jgi:hypothetical protein
VSDRARSIEEFEEVFILIGNFELLQELFVFLSERFLFVMELLVLDILHHCADM